MHQNRSRKESHEGFPGFSYYIAGNAGDYMMNQFKSKLVGEGAYGRAVIGWTVHEGKPSRKVCVKMIEKNSQIIDHERWIRAEKDTCQRLKDIENDNLMKVYDVFGKNSSSKGSSGMLYIITELCDTDLGKHLESRGPLCTEDARRTIKQVSEGMKELWERNIIHRDLKPSNILLMGTDPKTWKAKVADFGQCKILELNRDLTRTRGCGSPIYSAPEVTSGVAEYSARCDVWSLGVVLFEILVGRPPFEEKNDPFSQLFSCVDVNKVEYPESMDPLAKDLIEKCLVYSSNKLWEDRIDFEDFYNHPFLRDPRKEPHVHFVSSPSKPRRRSQFPSNTPELDMDCEELPIEDLDDDEDEDEEEGEEEALESPGYDYLTFYNYDDEEDEGS